MRTRINIVYRGYMFIYKITNIKTNDCYIGKTTKTPELRFKQHLSYAKSGGKTHLCNALNKYGKECFSLSIIEEDIKTHEELNIREVFWIKTQTPKYNMTVGGDGCCGLKHTKQSCEKRSKLMIGKNKGPRSEEIKNKISKSKLKYSKPFFVDGYRYDSLLQASKCLNISKQTIHKRLKSKNFELWFYE